MLTLMNRKQLPKWLAAGLFVFTTAAVAVYPTLQRPVIDSPTVIIPPVAPVSANQRPKVELVFALDTTGSMSGLIEAAREKIWAIATTMASAQPAPEIRIGLVAFRDRGDAYITQVTDLSEDLDSMYATLMDFKADGGGDGPESVNQALYEAVNNISWSQGNDVYRAVFLVGDAPPHMDYQGEVQYPETIRVAKNKGIIVNTIQAGSNHATAHQWQRIASLSTGEYFQVEQSGSAIALSTPYDKELAKLSAELDDTRLYYGDEVDKIETQRKVAAAKKIEEGASIASRARRATFNASESGYKNLFGDKDIVADVNDGRIDLDAIPEAELPAPLVGMAPEKQKQLIDETADKRAVLQERIQGLTEQRNKYLRNEVDALGETKEESLDIKLFDAVKSQAGAAGMIYEDDQPSY